MFYWFESSPTCSSRRRATSKVIGWQLLPCSGFVLADDPGAIRKASRRGSGSSRPDEDPENPYRSKNGEVNYTSSKAPSMAKPAPVTIPTEPIGSIPRPVDLIERRCDSRNH